MDEWFAEYGQSHQNPTNKRIHWLCVPAIFFSIVVLLAAIPSSFLKSMVTPEWQPYLHWGTLALVPVWLFYVRRSRPLALGIMVFSALCLYGVKFLIISDLPLTRTGLAVFVVAWVGQFIGHKIEGEKPSFFKDIQFLLIGPAWLLSFIYRKLGLAY